MRHHLRPVGMAVIITVQMPPAMATVVGPERLTVGIDLILPDERPWGRAG